MEENQRNNDLCKVNREKRIALIASVKGREEQLKIVLSRIYDSIDEIRIVLNWYTDFPDWLKDKSKITAHLINPYNKNAHDAIWNFTYGNGYFFVLDDDLYYPENYIEKCIEAIERHGRKKVITVHGANLKTPVYDYLECRYVYGFSDELERDIYVQLAGCGTVSYHSSTIRPSLQHFPIPFCRDLWFSLLCVKRNISIVSIQRSNQWILPLKTNGETVWEATRNNEKLKTIKNRILKEQLLPKLYCNKDIDKYVCVTDYDFDEHLLCKSFNTLESVSKCNRIVFSNNPKRYETMFVDKLFQYVTNEELAIGRMGSKVLTQYRFMNNLSNGSKIISADADLYYLEDPFTAFEKDFDIAITTRPHKYHYPINGGVVMFRMSDRLRPFLEFIISQIYELSWPELVNFQEEHEHSGNDWYIDQDIWCCCWLYKNLIKERFDINIVDVGPTYNFCPHADGSFTESGKNELREAYRNKSAKVLHLKSRLKELLFDGELS